MKTKTIYLFDETTGEYLSEGVAHESPLEPGVFHTPIFSTDTPPPLASADERAVFESGVWVVKPALVTAVDGVETVTIEPTYAQLRAAAYPPIADQLDVQFKDALNGTTTWVDSIAAIKAKYPKPVV
jgi:hypothetical protein